MAYIDSLEKLLESSRPAYLVLIYSGIPEAPETGRRFEMLPGKQEWIIGSSFQDDIQLDPEVAAEQHARVYQEEGHWYFTNLTSDQKTYSNRILTRDHLIEDGDTLIVGQALFKFFSGVGANSYYDNIMYEKTTNDALTGIYNRGFFDQSILRECKRCIRQGQSISLLMLDADKFKEINTKYGHRGGDEVLRQITKRILSERVREDEIFARYGGEEFVLILPQATKEQALHIAEQIRVLVEKDPIMFKNQQISATISAGVATLPPLQDPKSVLVENEVSSLIEEANAKMQQAKDAGRNQIVG